MLSDSYRQFPELKFIKYKILLRNYSNELVAGGGDGNDLNFTSFSFALFLFLPFPPQQTNRARG